MSYDPKIRIIKPGNQIAAYARGTCPKCGCVFEAPVVRNGQSSTYCPTENCHTLVTLLPVHLLPNGVERVGPEIERPIDIPPPPMSPWIDPRKPLYPDKLPPSWPWYKGYTMHVVFDKVTGRDA